MKKGEQHSEIRKMLFQLVNEKNRHEQEKLVHQISSFKEEETAELVAELLYSNSVYLRNEAIEILVALGEKSLNVLKKLLLDSDRNIRRFALDILKHIHDPVCCEMAVEALHDDDENVVEGALEVIAVQSYKGALPDLLHLLKKTNSIWLMNALIRTFEQLELKSYSKEIAEKIKTMNISPIGRNLLMNTYTKALGKLGLPADIELIIDNYAREYIIEPSNIIIAISHIILNYQITELPKELLEKVKKIYAESWDYKDPEQFWAGINALCQLQLNYFLDQIPAIHAHYSGEEFFVENLYEALNKLYDIPFEILDQLLHSEEKDLIILGLKLLYSKEIKGHNAAVKTLCESDDKEIRALAIKIVTDLQAYKNTFLLKQLAEYSEEAAIAYMRLQWLIKPQPDDLFENLKHQSKKVRQAAAKLLIETIESMEAKTGERNRKTKCRDMAQNLDADRLEEVLEEIIKQHPGEDGLEALEVMLRVNPSLGWKYIFKRTESHDEKLRAGLIQIANIASYHNYYSFMKTMINDPSPMVRRMAVKALIQKSNAISLQLLLQLYKVEWDSLNKMEIISGLYKFKEKEALDAIIEGTYNPDPLIRIGAVKGLKVDRIYNKKDYKKIIRERIEKLLDDPVAEVREEAKIALDKIEVKQ